MWDDTLRMDFDSRMIDKLSSNSNVVDRVDPTYVYRWSSSGEHHCSGVSTGPEDESWYLKTPSKRDNALVGINPWYDDNTLYIKDCLKQLQP